MIRSLRVCWQIPSLSASTLCSSDLVAMNTGDIDNKHIYQMVGFETILASTLIFVYSLVRIIQWLKHESKFN